jgi:hypothetical protein
MSTLNQKPCPYPEMLLLTGFVRHKAMARALLLD